VGYTTKEHLILDLDRAKSLTKAIKFARMSQAAWPDTGDCLLAYSSEGKYHAVYDSRLSWGRIMNICRTLAGLALLDRDFIKIRDFREDLTLRVSSVDRGLTKSAAPLPVALVLVNPEYDHYTLCDSPKPHIEVTLECKVSLKSLRADLAQEKFSGIESYLKMLSTFRQLESVLVQIA
jgi:hypothetical protein